MGLAEGIAPKIHQILFTEGFAADSTGGMMLLQVAVQMPGHAIVFYVFVFDGLPASGAFQASWMKRTAIKANKRFVQKRFFAGSTVKTMCVPMTTKGFQTISVDWLSTALAEIHVLPWPCDAYSITLAGAG